MKVTALVLALSATLVAGCSHPADTLDQATTERAVGRAVTKRVDVRVVRTACPADIAREEGRAVTCTVSLKGVDGTLRARVRQLDGDGTLDVSLLDAVLANHRATTELQAQMKARFPRPIEADCGTGLRIVSPGDTFRCLARDEGGGRAVQVTVTDAAGTLRFKILT